ncbi:MAG: hypothetical protein PHR28_05600 [candidate division Zixibacteria bacterium]|nr:hypothetical protein [candidate division Zixibacteria bacterium]
MNASRRWIVSLFLMVMICSGAVVNAATNPSDSTVIPPDTTAVDSLPPTPASPPSDSAKLPPIDTVAGKTVQYSLPVRFIDSLTAAFARYSEEYDIRQYDLYPRNGADFMTSFAEYFAMTYHETPLRTTVQPFGLPGQQMTVFCGANRMQPYDRVIPADGLIDFDDIATADLEGARIIEGPIAGAAAPDGGLSLLYLKPMAIPQDRARSEFTMERGSLEYAYTRARVARMLSKRLGFFLSTDYRKGASRSYGTNFSADDSSYCVKTQLLYHIAEKTTCEFSLDAYRRTGGFPVEPDNAGYGFRRLRRDYRLIFSVTQHDVKGGQLAGKFEYQKSKSAYSSTVTTFYRTLTPRFYRTEISYLLPKPGRLYEMTLGGGKEKYTIDGLDGNRDYAYVSASGLNDFSGGRLFAMGRWRIAEHEQYAPEGTVGLVKNLSAVSKGQLSVGYLCRWPDVADRIAPERFGAIGGNPFYLHFTEYGNPDLNMEKRLAGNAALEYRRGRMVFSTGITAGMIHDLIYYDRRYDSLTMTVIQPANDKINFGDLSISVSVDTLGPFYGMLSAAVRKVDSDRWGSRPPYSPRWQVYGRLGLRHYVAKYKIRVRLFGDLSYTELPLSYRREELSTGAMIMGGFNLSLKDLTFYYMVHNSLNQYQGQPDGYGYSGWYNSWGVNWKFLD